MFASDVCASPFITYTNGGDPRNECRSSAFADRLDWEERQTRISEFCFNNFTILSLVLIPGVITPCPIS